MRSLLEDPNKPGEHFFVNYIPLVVSLFEPSCGDVESTEASFRCFDVKRAFGGRLKNECKSFAALGGKEGGGGKKG